MRACRCGGLYERKALARATGSTPPYRCRHLLDGVTPAAPYVPNAPPAAAHALHGQRPQRVIARRTPVRLICGWPPHHRKTPAMLDALLGPSPIPLSAESPGQCSPSAMPGATAEARSHPQGGPWALHRRSISRLRALRDSAGESSAVAFSIYGRVHDCPGGVVVCVFLVTHHPRFNRTYIHPRIKSGDSPRVRVDPRVTSEKHPARITVPRATVPDMPDVRTNSYS